MSLRDDSGHERIKGEAGDIVDEICAGFEGGSSDRRVSGVARDRDVGARAEELNDRDDALEFLKRRDRRGAWASGFAADVDDGGAVLNHLERGFESASRVEMQATVGERVWGTVEDTHDMGSTIKPECFAGESER